MLRARASPAMSFVVRERARALSKAARAPAKSPELRRPRPLATIATTSAEGVAVLAGGG